MNEKKIFKELEGGGLFNYLHKLLYGADPVKYDLEEYEIYSQPSYVKRRRGSYTREEAQAKAIIYREHLLKLHRKMQAEMHEELLKKQMKREG